MSGLGNCRSVVRDVTELPRSMKTYRAVVVDVVHPRVFRIDSTGRILVDFSRRRHSKDIVVQKRCLQRRVVKRG